MKNVQLLSFIGLTTNSGDIDPHSGDIDPLSVKGYLSVVFLTKLQFFS